MSHSDDRTASTNGARKLVIKPFKVQPKLPENFWDESWDKLQAAVGAVYLKNSSTISKEELYRTVEDLCKQKQSGKLYDSLVGQLRDYIARKVDTLLSSQLSGRLVVGCGELPCPCSSGMERSLNYALQTAGAQVLWDLGHNIFRKKLDELPQLESSLIQAVLAMIDKLRRGAIADGQQIGQICQMLITLQLYHNVFQPSFLREAAQFYASEGRAFIEQVDPNQFLLLVDKRLNEAVELTTKYLDFSSQKSLVEVIEGYLLAPHITTLIERGVSSMLSQNQIADLRRMFVLFDRVQALDKLKVAWSIYIKLTGEGITSPSAQANVGGVGSNAKDSQSREIVEEVIFLQPAFGFVAAQEKLLAILKEAFFNNEFFKQSLRSAFDYFLNLNMRSTAEQLARYLDRKLRGEKGLTEADTEQKLDQAIFKYLQEKDMFEAFYKKHLAKRLLTGKSASYEMERNMLSKLKAECGANFTAKLEGMFQDIEMSKECHNAFVAALVREPPATMHNITSLENSPNSYNQLADRIFNVAEPEMQIQVLTTGYWPNVSSLEGLQLPPELLSLVRKFDIFYNTKYQGRRLVWAHSLARCIVTFRLIQGSKKELDLSMFQALVLRCFSLGGKHSLEELKTKTGIETEELKRTLLSLCNGPIGTRVLVKEPRGRDVQDADSFIINNEFSNKLFRIKINTIQVKETAEEVQRTHEEVFRDREYQVDAAIVRIMKARKRLLHSTLISEVMAQLRFPAQSSDLKKRIEALIERDFLERDSNDPSTYNYLA
eukprot:scaffold2798_cov160-Ochromonas_danica.AAC.3